MHEHELPLVECKGSPKRMGRQYGEQAVEAIRANIAVWELETANEIVQEFAVRAGALLKRFVPEVYDELVGLAEGAGVELVAMLRLNQVNTFEVSMPSPGCTSMAIADGPEGPVLGKNNDGKRDGRRFLIRKTIPEKGQPMIQVTYAGWLSGLDALNGAGLVNGHSSVGSRFDKSGDRLDIRLWVYDLMRRCGTVNELLAAIETVPLTGKGFNIVCADASGDTGVIEAAVPLIAVRNRGGAFVYAANHFASEPLKDADRRTPDAKPISVLRHGYLVWRETVNPPSGQADIAEILRGHEPWAPCRHGGVHRSETLWSMIGLPRQRRLRVASGAPCCHEYRDVEL